MNNNNRMEKAIVVDIVVTYDYRTPEQKRMKWKPKDYNPDIDPFRDVPLPKMCMQIPHIIKENTPVGLFKPRHKEYGENK